jgi:ABC-2 type transport system permease protein
VITTRLGHPRISGLVAGKAVAAALVGAALALVAEVVLVVGGAAILIRADEPVHPLDHGVPAAVASCLLVGSLSGVAGVGIGELLRNPTLAVGVVLGWAFVVEGVLPVVLREPRLTAWLPTGATRSALAAGLSPGEGMLGPWAGLSIVVGVATALLCAGLVRAARTDP